MQVIRNRSRMGLRAAAVFVVLLFAPCLPAAAKDEAAAIGELLSVGAPPVTDIDAALGPDALADLKRAYAARNDRPIWLGSDAGRALIDRLAQPDVTIGPKLQPLLDDARKRIAASDPSTRAGADLLLTALYGATAQALRPDGPAGFAEAMHALNTTTDLATLLREPPPTEAVDAEAAPPETVEAPQAETPPSAPATPPEDPEAARLKAAVASLRDWPVVPEGEKMQQGDSGPRVEALRRRLIASGDLASSSGDQFDQDLKSALERFQARHGLPVDGVAGAGTLAALNVPAAERAASLSRNIARSGARNWGERYLLVNIPAATWRLVEGGRTIAEGPAILGAPATPTPVLDAVIDRIELRPSYHIPQSVADRQLWPRQEQDALYFVNHGIRVTDDGLRQVPGANNPLGVAKLPIAGNDRIALHGAPSGAQSQDAFKVPERHVSLGCVALPNIADVVKPLLAADPAWPVGRIDGALAVGGPQVVALARPLPVHFVYDTAWVDSDGTIQFRPDVYGWDKQPPEADANTVPEPCGS